VSDTQQRPSIGFLGIGSMGRHMAARLIAAGYDVTAWNRSPGPAEELASSGAKATRDASEAFGRDVAISILANDAAVRDVVGAALASGSRPRIHVNMATISVGLAAELAEQHRQAGIAYVASPVFGRPEAAEAGLLNIVPAGDPAIVAEIEPILMAMGRAVWPVGSDPAAANAAKIAGNLMIACAIEAMGEASALAGAFGVPAARFLEIMTETIFASPAYKSYGALIAAERYQPAAFKLPLGLKDVTLALDAAGRSGADTPFAQALKARFERAIAEGLSDHDWAAIARLSKPKA
jgi:3-hydroxyisobutyrate dehydrogenase-like beta-hydroxyacid dehydrogenase